VWPAVTVMTTLLRNEVGESAVWPDIIPVESD
jgi:hypothetical protein